MKKILFIIPYIPYPLNSGGNQAFFNMVEYIRKRMSVSVLLYPRTTKEMNHIEALQKIWDNVTFFVFQENKEPIQKSFYFSLLEKIKASVTRKMRRRLNKLKKDPVREKAVLFQSVFPAFPSQYLDYVANISRQGFDIIQVEFYELISLGYILPQDVESVFVHHEIRYIRNENEMNLFHNLTEREKMIFQVAKDYERAALQQYKHIIALTDTDKYILEQFIGENKSIFSSPAVIQPIKEHPFQPATSNRLTFIGSGDHYPNNDAMQWFISEIIPILHKKGFRFTLDIIGSWNSYDIKAAEAFEEIRMTGFIPDLAAHISGSIALIPIRIGSGMRMKALDAVAAQVPIITTTKGIEGIDLRNEEECLIADSPEAFADAIIRLSQNTDQQKKLSANASERLKALYQPERMLEKRMNVYRQITGECLA